MCHATGANFELWHDCRVRTNRTSSIMLKIEKEPKTELMSIFVLSEVNSDSVFCSV
jgi:hypothetical protein